MFENDLLSSVHNLNKTNKIHFWIPNIFHHPGGIQTYSFFFLQIIQKINKSTKYDIFLKHDIAPSFDVSNLSNTKFHFAGRYILPIRTFFYAIQLVIHGLLQKPNLIIATHLNFIVVAYWLKKIAGIPYWTVAHGIEAWNITNPQLQKALKNADKILAVSNYTRERLLKEQELEPNLVYLLHNTFDSDRFQIKQKPSYLLERYGLNYQQPIILTVARLSANEQYKGYDKIIASLPKIKEKFPDIHYLLVGKGDDSARIKQLIKQFNLHNNITLAGFVSDEELCDHYNLCDIFAMPSKGEGFGIVYLEAMACGKPTLGGNKDAAIDALCGGDLGVLVDPDNVEEIANKIIEILERKYPNSLIYQPQMLREKVINKFGFESFQKTLSGYLHQHYT